MTNAVRFAGDPARTPRYSEHASASLISLSLRHFREHLLIEVYDTGDTPPVLSRPGDDAESGRNGPASSRRAAARSSTASWTSHDPPA